VKVLYFHRQFCELWRFLEESSNWRRSIKGRSKMYYSSLTSGLFVGLLSIVGGVIAAPIAEAREIESPAPVEIVQGGAAQIGGAASPGGRNINVPLAMTKTLGALSNDLVYTPVQPCRIVDTRSTAAGVIPAAGTRSFVAINASNFTSQGGSATNCGTLGLSATAVAVNFTAVFPTAQGFLTAYPFGTVRPTAATMVYVPGDLLSNFSIVQIPNPLSSFDFTVFSAAQTHVVADIVGYFAPPVATALQCVETANENLDIPGNGGTGNAVAPVCATGYTQTATNCETTSWLMPIVFFQSGTCSARNGDTATRTLRASRTCCRVPGR
jgi:hypothetical protein